MSAMPQLTEMRHNGDDWTGISDAKERKRRQNRLHQRAYRKKRRQERILKSDIKDSSVSLVETPSQPTFMNAYIKPDDLSSGVVLLTSQRKIAQIRAFAKAAYEDFTLRSHRLSYLPALTRLNVLNAVSANAITLSISVDGLCHDESISPFNLIGPPVTDRSVSSSSTSPSSTSLSIPQNLLPTKLQREIVHHPWIDLFPWPQMRDNMLQGVSIGKFDEDDLCCDIMEVRNDQPHLLVWGHPSDTRGWEASETFLRKWGFLVHDCHELMIATNYWRERRGTPKLNIHSNAYAV